MALPPQFPLPLIHHEPGSTQCTCGCALKRIGEKLDYTPSVFTVERHICGKWVCDLCGTLIQAPVPAQVIDKSIPTAGLAIPRTTLAQWVGTCGVELQPLVDAGTASELAELLPHNWMPLRTCNARSLM